MNKALKIQLTTLKELYYKGSRNGRYEGAWFKRKLHKVIMQPNGHILIWGSGRPIQTHYTAKGKLYFYYEGRRCFLDDFMTTCPGPWGNPPHFFREFDGYLNDSFFSGVLIKLEDGETDAVKAFTFCS